VNSGNHYQLTASLSSAKWKTSDSSVATVSNGIITAKDKGTATITAYTATQSVTCKVTVNAASEGISIYKSSAQITAGKSYYNGATSSVSVTWSSSDSNVAKVQNGFITAVAPGKAVITAHNSKGTKTCLITVTEAEPVRFTYSTPNTAAINEKVTLSAVTDTERTAVKFEITVGGKVKTIEATTKAKDGNVYIWNGTTTIASAGTYNVVAYAKTKDGDWKTCSSG
ncbi:MAG: Ig-like domain-containing protein, partial [Ruminococcus sp.]|nr:Ig-like domain-containing protein [Ruminococcus sp.]